MEEVARVRECLNRYEKASGQMINFAKSALSFSPNTHPMAIETIKSVLTIPVVQQHDLYLGLPTVSMKHKRIQFQYLVERVVKRTQGLNNKWFSAGGKEVLIKSILQAIPTYAMSCFKIPLQICDEIEKVCANFWWRVDNGKRKLHWRSWDFLCHPKSRGGLGFRKMTDFNRALLAKQLWRLIRDPDSLVCRVLKGRYYRHVDIMDAGLGTNRSYIWCSLLWSKDILKNGLLWRVDDGSSIRIFEDKWVPSLKSTIGTPLATWTKGLTMSSLIQEGSWDAELITNNFNSYIAGEILNIPLSSSVSRDIRFWRYDQKGLYSVRDGYRFQRGLFVPPMHQSDFPNEKWWTFLWGLSLPPRTRIFWWQMSHDCIPTNMNLYRHHVPISGMCSLCAAPFDTTCHSLFYCSAIRHLWKATKFAQLLKAASGEYIMDLCLWMKTMLSKTEFAVYTWAVWKARQTFLHGSKDQVMVANVDWSSVLLRDFHHANTATSASGVVKCRARVHHWVPPALGSLKLNTDACVNQDLYKFSIGGVLRDNQGRLLMVFGKQITQPLSVVHGELLAILESVKLLYEKNYLNVMLESDSLLAVQAVTANQDDLGYVGVCASEVEKLLRRPVISGIAHVSRSANMTAHKIACFVSSSHPSFVWMNGEFLSWLVKLVIDDYS